MHCISCDDTSWEVDKVQDLIVFLTINEVTETEEILSAAYLAAIDNVDIDNKKVLEFRGDQASLLVVLVLPHPPPHLEWLYPAGLLRMESVEAGFRCPLF